MWLSAVLLLTVVSTLDSSWSLYFGPLWPTKYWKNTTACQQHKPQTWCHKTVETSYALLHCHKSTAVICVCVLAHIIGAMTWCLCTTSLQHKQHSLSTTALVLLRTWFWESLPSVSWLHHLCHPSDGSWKPFSLWIIQLLFILSDSS